MNAESDLHDKFDGSQQAKLDPALLKQLNVEPIQAHGIEIAEATLAQQPSEG